MGSIAAIDLMNQTQDVTQDLKKQRWVAEEQQRWLNAALREIVVHRPDAHTLYYDHNCANKAEQRIPDNGLRFMECSMNVASGYTIMPINKADLDEVQRNWQDPSANTTEVENYIYDDRFPEYFHLYPVPVVNHQVRVGYSAVPATIQLNAFDGSDKAPIALADNYANQVMDYMLARMYQKQTNLTRASEKSQMHFSLFYQSLGVKFDADFAASPNNAANRQD